MFAPQMLSPLNLSAAGQSGHAPNFIGLGTPKAGTSWWYTLMLQHPQVTDNDFGVKETCFFCHPWQPAEQKRLLQHYEAGFQNTKGVIKGEWSTLYFSHPFALPRLLDSYPDARYLLIFREPVACLVSWINQVLRNRARHMLAEHTDARRMYLLYDLIPGLSQTILSYPARLAALQQQCRDNLLVLQYEQNVAAPHQNLQRTFSFLGIDASFVPDRIDQPVNKSEPSQQLPELELPTCLLEQLQESGRALLEQNPEFEARLWTQ